MFVCIYTESGISTDTRLLSLLLVSTSSYLAGLKESANVVLVVVDIIANCCGRSRCLSLQQLLLLGCGKWRMRRRRLNGHCIHLCQLLLLSLLLLLLRRSPLPFTLAQTWRRMEEVKTGVRGVEVRFFALRTSATCGKGRSTSRRQPFAQCLPLP